MPPAPPFVTRNLKWQLPSLAAITFNSCLSQVSLSNPLASVMSILFQQPIIIGSLRCISRSRWPPPHILLQPIAQKQSPKSRSYHCPPSHTSRSFRGSSDHHVPAASLLYSLPGPTLLPSELRYRRAYFSSGRSPYEAGSILTKAITAFCILSFAVYGYPCFLRDRQNDPRLSAKYEENCVCSPRNLREGRWWVLLTSSLAHASLLHLGINMYALYSIAPTTIAVCGIPGFVALWGVTSITCSGASIYWEEINNRFVNKRWDTADEAENSPSFLGITPTSITGEVCARHQGGVGASGVLFGMTTVLTFMRPNLPVQFVFIPIGFPIWAFTTASAGLSWWALANGAVRDLGHAGHLGGMMGGFGFWLLRTVAGRGR